MTPQNEFQPVAILGYGALFPPDSYDAESYWRNLLSGKPGISTPPPERWDWKKYHSPDRSAEDKTYCKFGGFIDDYEFPHEKFGLSTGELKGFNRTQLMILDTALQAAERSGYGPKGLRKGTVGLFVGNMLGDELLAHYSMGFRAQEMFHHIKRSEEFRALPAGQQAAIERGFFQRIRDAFPDPEVMDASSAFQGNLAKSVGSYLGLSGTSAVCDAACASGLLVIDVAIKYLQDGSHDVVLACGAMGNMGVTGNVSFSKIGGLSETHSSPLDASANGLIPGEGAGTVVLKRLDDAIKDGDSIRGVIRGVASRTDGKGKAIYAPSSRGQVAAMSESLKLAGLNPEDLDHVETHATATPTGDAVEVESLKQLYEGRGCGRGTVSLGSVKAQIGHTFPAAGMANLIKILLSFEHETLPPTHGYRGALPKMGLGESPFYVNTEKKHWPARDERVPRRAGANAFGFGGINTNVCVEEYHPAYHEALSRRLRAAPPKKQTSGPKIAVVGRGCVTEHARNAEQYGLRDKMAGVGGFPENRWHRDAGEIHDPHGTWRVSAIRDLDFPWKEYRIPPHVLSELDRSQLMAAMAAGEAIKDHGQDPVERRDMGVFIGAFGGLESGLSRNLRIRLVEFEGILGEVPEFRALAEPVRRALVEAYVTEVGSYIPTTKENALPGYMDNIMGGRIGNLFDLRNTNMMVDSDTCSFGAALDIAIKHLTQGDCRSALVGGVHANLTPEFLDLTGRYRQTTGRADAQIVPGEGAAFFVLKKLEDVGDRDEVYAVIAEHPRAEEDVAGAGRSEEPFSEGPFYFGAQGAFRLLEHVEDLRNARTTGREEPPSVPLDLPSMMEGHAGYRFRVIRHLPADEAGESWTVEPDGRGTEAQLELPGACFVEAATFPGILDALELLRRDPSSGAKAGWSPSAAGSEEGARYRLGIAYDTKEELERKINLSLRLLHQSAARAPRSARGLATTTTQGGSEDVRIAS